MPPIIPAFSEDPARGLDGVAVVLIALALWGFALILLLVLGWPSRNRARAARPNGFLYPPPAAHRAHARPPAPALGIPVVWYDNAGRTRVQWAELRPPPD